MSRLTDRELRLIDQARNSRGRGPTFEADASPTTDGATAKVSPHRARPEHGLLYRAVVDHLVKPLAQAARRRRTIAQLRDLDDRILDDIGLARSGIEHVVRAAPRAETIGPAATRQDGLFAALMRWYDRQNTIHYLESLDDRQLQDIGIPRHQIETLVSGKAARGGPGLWQRFKQWRARQASIRQLQALDDRVLADIGVHRTDIAAVVELGQRRPVTRAVHNGADRRVTPTPARGTKGSAIAHEDLIAATKWIPEVIAINTRAAVAKRQSW